MTTPAGKRDKRISFERASIERGELGGRGTTAWTALGSRWAGIFYGTGAERRNAAGTEQAVQAATFNVNADSLTRTVTVGDRISFAGLVWDIEGVALIGHGPREIDFTCAASRG